jgi:hypothetical protein
MIAWRVKLSMFVIREKERERERVFVISEVIVV